MHGRNRGGNPYREREIVHTKTAQIVVETDEDALDRQIEALEEENTAYEAIRDERMIERQRRDQLEAEEKAIKQFIQDFPHYDSMKTALSPEQLEKYNKNRYYLSLMRRRKAGIRDEKRTRMTPDGAIT